MRPSYNLENNTLSDTYWRVQLIRMKVQAQSSLEPPLEYNQDQMPLMNQGSLWTVFNHHQLNNMQYIVCNILCSFRLVLKGKTGKVIPKSSRLELVSKIIVIPWLEGWPTKDREAPSPHEVRLTQLDTKPVFRCLRSYFNVSIFQCLDCFHTFMILVFIYCG